MKSSELNILIDFIDVLITILFVYDDSVHIAPGFSPKQYLFWSFNLNDAPVD